VPLTKLVKYGIIKLYGEAHRNLRLWTEYKTSKYRGNLDEARSRLRVNMCVNPAYHFYGFLAQIGFHLYTQGSWGHNPVFYRIVSCKLPEWIAKRIKKVLDKQEQLWYNSVSLEKEKSNDQKRCDEINEAIAS